MQNNNSFFSDLILHLRRLRALDARLREVEKLLGLETGPLLFENAKVSTVNEINAMIDLTLDLVERRTLSIRKKFAPTDICCQQPGFPFDELVASLQQPLCAGPETYTNAPPACDLPPQPTMAVKRKKK